MTLQPEFAPQWRSTFVETGSVRLHALETGSGPTLLCLHGTSMSAHCWGHLAASLRDGRKVIALDMRGHGRSDRPPTDYTVAELAGDVIAAIETLGAGPAAIIGSSVGTQVAVSVSATRPDLVSGLILSDPSFFVGDAEVLRYLRSHHFRPRRFGTSSEAEAFCRALPQRSGLRPELHRFAMQGDFREHPDSGWQWAYDLAAITKVFLNLGIDQSSQFGRVRAPVLILNAEKSNVLSADQALNLVSAFPNARLVTAMGSNHTIWGDSPDFLATQTRRFLEDL